MKCKLVLMCGSHMRHLYLAKQLYEQGRLAALVIEQREEFVPVPPAYLTERDRKNFIHHFAERDRAERAFFGSGDSQKMFDDVPMLQISQEELNGAKTIEFIREAKADLLLTYGVHKLSGEVIACYEGKSFNVHGGLSPWYRGNTTLFWPFYFLKPNWAGMTIHRLSVKLDGGDILHHSVPVLEHGDKMHEVACKAVVQVAQDLCRILECMDQGKELICQPQTSAGKLFLGRDWAPQMLRVVYELFEDKIVDLYLDGELAKEEPKLVDFFAS